VLQGLSHLPQHSTSYITHTPQPRIHPTSYLFRAVDHLAPNARSFTGTPFLKFRLHLLDLLEVYLYHIANLMLLAVDGANLVLVELDLGFERAPGVLVGVIFLDQLGLEASNFRVWGGEAE
jgi:hypothetical protein